MKRKATPSSSNSEEVVENKNVYCSMLNLQIPSELNELVKGDDFDVNTVKEVANKYFKKILKRSGLSPKNVEVQQAVAKVPENQEESQLEEFIEVIPEATDLLYSSEGEDYSASEAKQLKLDSCAVIRHEVHHIQSIDRHVASYAVLRKSGHAVMKNEDDTSSPYVDSNNGFVHFVYWVEDKEFYADAYLSSRKSNLHSDFLLFRKKKFVKRVAHKMLDPHQIPSAEVTNYLGKVFFLQ